MDEAIPCKILILDPELERDERLQRYCVEQLDPVEILVVGTASACLEAVHRDEYDILVADYDLEDVRRSDFIPSVRLAEGSTQVQLFTRSLDPDRLRELSRLSYRFLVKGDSWEEVLCTSLRGLLKLTKIEHHNEQLKWKLTAAKQLLEEKNKRLDEFSATVAHDIRGPLGGVIMKLEYILETYEATLEERVARLLNRSLDSAQRLTNLVQAMYDFAKIGLRPGTLVTVGVGELVEQVIGDLDFKTELDIRIGVGDLPRIEANGELLRRVFLNLIVNAVKYNDKDVIRVNIGTERYFENALGKFCEIFVEDNGPGIPERDRSEIFSMFKRGSMTGSETEGLGIGLSVVQKIVELHYGSISVQSDPAWGTKFLVALPLQRVEFSQ